MSLMQMFNARLWNDIFECISRLAIRLSKVDVESPETESTFSKSSVFFSLLSTFSSGLPRDHVFFTLFTSQKLQV